MSKFSLIARLQHWMDSVPGQTFMNYAYSWGAAVVILGTLFKLTHIPGANAMLFIGMGTEVFVFFISGFDRPFDAKNETQLADEFISLDEMEALKVAAEKAAASGDTPVVVGGGGGVISGGGGGAIIGGGAISSGETVVRADGGGAVVGGGGGTVIIGGGAPSGGTVVIGGGVPSSPAVSVEGGVAAEGASSPNLATPGGAGLSATDAANLAVAAQAAAGAQAALAAAGGAEGLLDSAKAANAPEVEDAIEAYVDQLRELTETLAKVREQASRMSTDSVEMENLNRTLTGINTIYEMQLKSVSQQVGTIDEITEQTRRMAKQIEELNGVYARMIEALTVNMKTHPSPSL